MKFEKIDHICFAVRDLEGAKRRFREDFHREPDLEYAAPAEKIRVARYMIGEVGVEYMEPTDPDSDVGRFLETRGEGFFLISYKVDNVDNAMRELREKQIELIDRRPREIFGTRYAFIHHPDKLNGVLTEVIEGDFNLDDAKKSISG